MQEPDQGSGNFVATYFLIRVDRSPGPCDMVPRFRPPDAAARQGPTVRAPISGPEFVFPGARVCDGSPAQPTTLRPNRVLLRAAGCEDPPGDAAIS